ncbi:hypothetical protein J7E91_13140 [Streptomyces sp. ISL-99]|uniref:hypothetical protein n=1 Tax=Streptomyces sp. ISL-99 TaxID=2819193 RepID=UPI001BE4F9C5|nr:hypothetical protein [Streptomyces sp. ISL-99]MBT2526349.1 hypothetical protein [Streptomyces sp. ISL-99]
MAKAREVKKAERETAVDDGVLRRLDKAVTTGRLVRVHRSIPRVEWIEGFVIGASAEWTLLARCSDIQLDGWSALRTADITKVRRQGDETCLTIRALRRRGQWPVRVPAAIPLDESTALLKTAGSEFGLISVHRERQVPDACWIGAVTRLRPRSVRLREVDTGARWHADDTTFRFRDITRVDFGGRYETTLREFAGPYS